MFPSDPDAPSPGNHWGLCIYYVLPTVLYSANERNMYKQYRPAQWLRKCFENLVVSFAFLWNCSKSSVHGCMYSMCIYNILISQLLHMYIYIKTGLHTQASLYHYLRKFHLVQWNLSFPTTCGTKVWICSLLQTHEIVYHLWNPFYLSPVNPRSKIFLYSLQLKLCSWCLYTKEET